LLAQDAQWRGPERNDIYPDTGLIQEWPEGGPELLLMVDNLPGGYSTRMIYEERIYITGRRDTLDVITCLGLQGKLLWETIYGEAWKESFSETRNSPAIEDQRVYITSGLGNVVDLYIK
jgi:outer membrane protein assembly factor BamB